MVVTLLKFDPDKPFSEVSEYIPLLSAERRARVERLKTEQSRVESLISGLLLSAVLSERCGTSPDKLRFAYGEHGKPYLPDYPECCFSLSHSRGYAALACDDEPVGADIQQILSQKQHALRFLHPDEQKSILSAEDKAEQFCRIWTMKEAYVKLTGEGMSRSFSSFDVLLMPESSFFTQRLTDHILTICTNKFTSQPEIHTITEIDLLSRFLVDENGKVW